MSASILAYTSPGEVRTAAVVGGRLLDIAINRPGRPDEVDAVFRGRTAARVPALAGVFIVLPDATGFLPDKAGGGGLTEGDVIAVRITRAASGGKGPRLALADGIVPGAGTPALLRRGPGAVERLAALHPDAEILTHSARLAAELRQSLAGRIRLVETLDPSIEEEMEELAGSDAVLPGGMRASFHPTPALTAIDVDTAAATGIKQPQRTAQLEANRAALPEIARQIRLRNLSGAILLDLAGLPAAKRQVLGPELERALTSDPLRPRLLGFTRLGLAEIVRTRVHPPLHEVLSGPHAAGLAALRRAAVGTIPGQRLAIRASPDVAAALHADPAALPELTEALAYEAPLRSDPSLSPCTAIIEEAGPVRPSNP